MIVSQKYQDLLQPNSRDRFSKISRTFYASRKSWIIVVFLQRTPKENLPIFLINTLLLHIPLLALTDRQNYRKTLDLGGWMGGNNKIAPPNRFARVKTFSCNRRWEATNIVPEKSLVLEEMDFWGENESAQKRFSHNSIFVQYEK